MYKTEGSDWCEQACLTPLLAPAVMKFGDVHFGRCDAHGYPKYDHTQDLNISDHTVVKIDLYKSSSAADTLIAPTADVSIYKVGYPVQGLCGQEDNVTKSNLNPHYFFPIHFGGFGEGQCADVGYGAFRYDKRVGMSPFPG